MRLIDSFSLAEVAEITTGKLDSNAATRGGEFPFFTCSPETLRIDTHAFDCEAVLLAGNNANGIFPVKHYAGKFNAYQRTYVITSKNPNELRTRYLYYVIQTLTSRLQDYSIGSATKFLTLRILNPLTFRIPTISEQDSVLWLLGGIDDKVELNRRMNDTLETIANVIFSEWFPITDILDSAKGKHRFGEIASASRESVNPLLNPDELFDHYSIPAYDDKRLPIAEKGSQIRSNKFIVHSDSVLLSKLNPRIPRVWLPSVIGPRRSICSTEFLVLRANQAWSREFVYGLCNSHAFQDAFSGMVTGTSGSHQRVKPEYLENLCVQLPPRGLVDDFTRVVKPVYARAALNLRENATLTTLRDALLPKLVSGEIRVAEEPHATGAKL
jgi:type I restriction enzyme S subunit